MIYFIPIILAILFANIYDFRKGTQGRMFCFALLCIVLILIAGFRYRVGGDTIRYMDSFRTYPPLSELRQSDFNREGIMPLCVLFFSFCKSISSSFYCLQFIHAIILNLTVFYFIKKQTRFIFSAVLFYMVWNYLEFNTEIVKESLAVCVILLGIDNISKKRYVRYYLFCILALGFHLSAIVAFLFPIFYALKFNVWGVVISLSAMLGFSVVYSVIPNYFEALNFITSDAETFMQRYYQEESSMGNYSTWIIYLSRWIILPLLSLILVKKGSFKNNFEFAGLILFGMIFSYFTQFSYAFHRFLNYVAPFFWLLLANAMVSIPTIKVFSPFRRQKLLVILVFTIYATVSINLIFMVPGKEDVLKYFPYTSMFNEVNVYRPEW